MIFLTVIVYQAVKLDKINLHELQTLKVIDDYQFKTYETVNLIFEIIDDVKETRTGFDKPLETDLTELNMALENLESVYPAPVEEKMYTQDSLHFFLVDIRKYHANIIGVGNLVMEEQIGLIDNQSIFKSQLRKSLGEVKTAVDNLRSNSSQKLSESHLMGFWINMIQALLFVFLAIYGYVRVIIPFIVVFKETKRIYREMDSDVERAELSEKKSNSLRIKSEKELLIKKAEVVKLKDSLDESIHQISRLSSERSFIYLNSATDLTGYLNVINKQKEILENQTKISEQDSWTPLTGAISQLNSLVGDYFRKSKESVNRRSDSEVYLSQLISEIILSASGKEDSKFEQIEDMPSIKTEVSLLNNTLKPYFELMVQNENKGSIRVSAFESGSVCEFKFIGLTSGFNDLVESIYEKETRDMDFNEFKVHMAKSAIISRGGKVWGQEDVANKGVFCIRWVL